MPRTPSPAVRTSLYRLVEVVDLRSAVQSKYLDREGFTAGDVTVAGRQAVLVLGTINTPTVPWAPTLHGLTGSPVVLGNETAVGILLVRGRTTVPGRFATAWGFRLLNRT